MADRIFAVGDAYATPLTGSVVDRLYEVIAVRLSGSPIGLRFLRALEARPAEPDARRDVVQAVAAESEADAGFAEEIRLLSGDLTVSGYGGQPPAAPGPTPMVAGAAGGKPRVNQGVVVVAAAITAVLLVLSAAFFVNVVSPYAGITEGARLDRLAGEWRGQVGDDQLVLTITADGVARIGGSRWPCVGQVSSPSRSSYTIDVDCRLVSTSLAAELDLAGDRLTVSWPGQSVGIVFRRV
ncbi:hypothetical protein GCM10027290_07060 [Micromonospora sonneratiae]